MKIEKEKRKVTIVCSDKTVITGFIHIDPGLRVVDFVNRVSEQFIIVTDADFSKVEAMRAFRLFNELKSKRTMICINKASIKWVEEL